MKTVKIEHAALAVAVAVYVGFKLAQWSYQNGGQAVRVS